MESSDTLSGILGLGSGLGLFFLIVAIMAMLMPFFVFRIRNEIISLNKKMSELISLLADSKNERGGVGDKYEGTSPKTQPEPHPNRDLLVEWLIGPDKDTTWKEANEWAESLAEQESGWSLPSVAEISISVKNIMVLWPSPSN